MERVNRTVDEFNVMSRDFLAGLKHIYGNRPAVIAYLDSEMSDLEKAVGNSITKIIPIQRYCELLNTAWLRKPGSKSIFSSIEKLREAFDDQDIQLADVETLDMGQEILNLFSTPAHEQQMTELDMLPDSDEKYRLTTAVIAEMLHNEPRLDYDSVQPLLYAGKELFSKCKGLDPVRQYMKWVPDQRRSVVQSVFMLTAICKAWEQTHGNETAAASMAKMASAAHQAYQAYYEEHAADIVAKKKEKGIESDW